MSIAFSPLNFGVLFRSLSLVSLVLSLPMKVFWLSMTITHGFWCFYRKAASWSCIGWVCICSGKTHLHVVFVGQEVSCFWDWYGWEVGGGLERLSVEKGSSKKSYFKV